MPCGPLRFADLYDGEVARMYDTKGYRVIDGAGEIAIERVSVIGSSVIKIVCARAPLGGAELLYADKDVHNGGGNVADSDPARSDSLSTVTGAAYPLANWCPPYRLAVGWVRP